MGASVSVSDYPIIFVNIETIPTRRASPSEASVEEIPTATIASSTAAHAAYACAYAYVVNPGDPWDQGACSTSTPGASAGGGDGGGTTGTSSV